MRTFLYALLSLIVVLVVACGIFLLVALIVSTINNIDFVEQLKLWFGIKENVATATNLLLNFIR